ncbi:MAG TPA: DUF3108 domain-containing protein [Gemmatimonadaceae bacterium]|nr:DUF3108 domain-containing protein [Gemmatimonadaceae bacterium]
MALARSRRVLASGALLALASAGAVAAQSASGGAAGQGPPASTGPANVPFGVGERLVYEVKFGAIRVGTGSMEVLDTVTLRGRPAWHTRFRVRGGVPFYRVDDVLESWIDRAEFNSLRFVQDFDEGGRERERRYEIYPERAMFQENDKPEETSVSNPLDDGSFLYFVRTIPLEVGKTYEFHRYFRPDRNPVIVKVVARERITVPAGTYETLVIQPIIKSKGIFSENGRARIWLSDDADRIMVQMKSRTKIGSLNLYLQSHRPPPDPAPTTPASPRR